ncbi:Por secretion system C-terminal sorting domain-containing protein [Saccharicrinis carchari]|uniref:N-acetylmuramoyl-L-alanine amidase n=1 Tax=Saccharicrinis carchari TaxID=1168039 RepID=A0A521B4T9_SACCC|nr:Ig-like domain-containing protein [Saccharicrinis carchari]SMO41700.1 Por secretion system C-terminal sorting domain-containing protein [Saccharicrinis carchari]
MKQVIPSLFFITIALCSFNLKAQEAPIIGLSDWSLFIDPGHDKTGNMGLYNYSEAEKVLRVAWALRDMLEQQTDISQVFLSRLSDQDEITLAARTDLANTLGADFYYSIHSDAGSPSVNSTLMLHGGWTNNGVTVEKEPNGGKALGDILDADLSGVMRIDTRGNWADRNFYLRGEYHHDNQFPYLAVNRRTNMASLLSEAGFHTNPGQQQKNLNAEWKKLEALSAFRSILEWGGIDRPAIGVATGIITDADSGLPINGVTVSIADKQYTTDTYESLFNQYSNDPEELRNGFYFIEGLTPGADVEVVFTADNHETKSMMLHVDSNPNGRTHENLSFLDVQLTSTIPPLVSGVEPSNELGMLKPGTKLQFTFSRQMDKTSVESAITLSDALVGLTYNWQNDFTLEVSMSGLEFVTQYTLTIDGSIAKNTLTDQFLDGDADGIAGGNYQLVFTTSAEDTDAPVLMDSWPATDAAITELRPILRLVYDEELNDASVGADAVSLKLMPSEDMVTGQVTHKVVNGQSVIHFFPAIDLNQEATYQVDVAAGLADFYGNTTEAFSYSFSLPSIAPRSINLIDPFDGTISGWWQPQQSGSTAGIITEETDRSYDASVANLSEGSQGSMRFNYSWDMDVGAPYIRLYLHPDAAQNTNRYNIEDLLQVYVFGDGSNTEFRFMARDGDQKYEASPWYSIDWMGWKLISWDLSNDPVYAWVNGNGVLDGTDFRLDGFHFRYVTGGAQKGTLYFDQFRFLAPDNGTSVPQLNGDAEIKLFPNPVQNILNIHADEPIKTVRIHSISGQLMMMEHMGSDKATLNVERLPAGVYLVEVYTRSGRSYAKIQVK